MYAIKRERQGEDAILTTATPIHVAYNSGGTCKEYQSTAY